MSQLSISDIKMLSSNKSMVPNATGQRLLHNTNITRWKQLKDVNPLVRQEYPDVYRGYYVQWWEVTLVTQEKLKLCFEIKPCV